MEAKKLTISLLQAGEEEKPIVSFGPSQKAQEPRAPMFKDRRRWMSQLEKRANSPFSAFLFYLDP